MSMRIALCNEVLRHLPFEEQCAVAATIGYDALELAPFTLGASPHRLSAGDTSNIRRALNDAGLGMSGLHMLLQAPSGLSITSEAPEVIERTMEVGKRLVALCAELGGRYLVHGSGQQRRLRDGSEKEDRTRALAYFETMAVAAADAGVIYCIEALAPDRTNFITSIADAATIVDAIGAPSLRTMLDCSHAAGSEQDSIPILLERYLPTGHVVHMHANEVDGGGPGSGAIDFAAILKTLASLGYDATIGVEPFVYDPDPITCAQQSIRHLRSCMTP
ncbi:MAG TPA: sugar phosphate isomerase/epimerase family protein [Pseudolabrys sp.]|nr:sugar phosphate isomerase/epimerase family protein [Pseudolabrys sp.]